MYSEKLFQNIRNIVPRLREFDNGSLSNRAILAGGKERSS
jgi:hypothetical protein